MAFISKQRIQENLLYLLIVIQILQQCNILMQHEQSHSNSASVLVLTLLVFHTQGVRLSMWPCIFTSWITIGSIGFGAYQNVFVIAINCLGFLISFSLFVAFGDGTFSKIKLTGKY